MSRVRILGIGSPSGDDQAGWLMVDALAACGVTADRDIAIEKLDRPGAHLITLLADAAWVILVDAMQSDAQAGRIRHFDQMAWPGYSRGLSSHGLGVLDALSLAQALGIMPARLDLYGIEIGSATPGDEPGIAVRSAARELARIVAAALNVFHACSAFP